MEFGPVLLKNRDGLFNELIINKISKNNYVINKIPKKKIVKRLKFKIENKKLKEMLIK